MKLCGCPQHRAAEALTAEHRRAWTMLRALYQDRGETASRVIAPSLLSVRLTRAGAIRPTF